MDLQELLGEELYNQVMQKAGENKIDIVSNGEWIPKEKFNQLNENLKQYKTDLKDRDKQLEELKKVNPEELQSKIQELQQENERIAQEKDEQLKQQAFDFALKEALSGAKAKNLKAVQALLKTDAIKLDGDKLLGLEEQLNTLKESDPYLFDVEQQQQQQTPPPKFSTGQHQKSSGGMTKETFNKLSYFDRLQLKQENPNLYNIMTGKGED